MSHRATDPAIKGPSFEEYFHSRQLEPSELANWEEPTLSSANVAKMSKAYVCLIDTQTIAHLAYARHEDIRIFHDAPRETQGTTVSLKAPEPVQEEAATGQEVLIERLLRTFAAPLLTVGNWEEFQQTLDRVWPKSMRLFTALEELLDAAPPPQGPPSLSTELWLRMAEKLDGPDYAEEVNFALFTMRRAWRIASENGAEPLVDPTRTQEDREQAVIFHSCQRLYQGGLLLLTCRATNGNASPFMEKAVYQVLRAAAMSAHAAAATASELRKAPVEPLAVDFDEEDALLAEGDDGIEGEDL